VSRVSFTAWSGLRCQRSKGVSCRLYKDFDFDFRFGPRDFSVPRSGKLPNASYRALTALAPRVRRGLKKGRLKGKKGLRGRTPTSGVSRNSGALLGGAATNGTPTEEIAPVEANVSHFSDLHPPTSRHIIFDLRRCVRWGIIYRGGHLRDVVEGKPRSLPGRHDVAAEPGRAPYSDCVNRLEEEIQAGALRSYARTTDRSLHH